MILRIATLSLVSLILAPVLALAAEAPATPKGAWDVGMIKDEKGGFGYCLARAPYSNGLTLAIAYSPKQEINLGVQVPDATFGKDDKYPMKVSIDGKLNRERVSMPVQKDLLLTTLGADKEAIGLLRKGKVLSMAGPQDTALFSLKGTGKALDGLQRCVDVGTGKVKPEDAAKAAAEAPAAKGGKPGKAPNFPPGLMGLLKAAGLADIKIVPVADPSKAPVDFAWQTGPVLGGLRERPVPKDATIEKMTSIIESSYKAQCKGTFDNKMGEVENLPGIKLRTADISCQMEGRNANVALLMYLTDTNLFSLFMHEAPTGNKEDAIKARDAIATKIRELAKSQGTGAPKAEAPKAETLGGAPTPASAAPAPAAAPVTPPAVEAAPATPAAPK